MLSCGQRNEDILTQAGTCHTDNINGHSQPKHQTNHHHHQAGVQQRTSVSLPASPATISNNTFKQRNQIFLSSAICSSPLALSSQFLFLLLCNKLLLFLKCQKVFGKTPTDVLELHHMAFCIDHCSFCTSYISHVSTVPRDDSYKHF